MVPVDNIGSSLAGTIGMRQHVTVAKERYGTVYYFLPMNRVLKTVDGSAAGSTVGGDRGEGDG